MFLLLHVLKKLKCILINKQFFIREAQWHSGSALELDTVRFSEVTTQEAPT